MEEQSLAPRSVGSSFSDQDSFSSPLLAGEAAGTAAEPAGTPPLPPLPPPVVQNSIAVGGRPLYPMLAAPESMPHNSSPLHPSPTCPPHAPSPTPCSLPHTACSAEPTPPQGAGRASGDAGSQEAPAAVVVVVSASGGIGRKRFSEAHPPATSGRPMLHGPVLPQDPLQGVPPQVQSIPS